MSNHKRNTPICPDDYVLEEIERRFRIEGEHIRSNYDYGSRRKVKKDAIVGTFSHCGRCAVSVYRRRVLLSHVAWFLSRGQWPRGRVVYVDGNYRNHTPTNLAYE